MHMSVNKHITHPTINVICNTVFVVLYLLHAVYLCTLYTLSTFASDIAPPDHQLSGNNLGYLDNRTDKLVEMVQTVCLIEKLQTSSNLRRATSLHLERKIVITSW